MVVRRVTLAPPRSAIDDVRTDPLNRLSRGLLYLGLFASPLLVIRVGAITLGDILLLGSIAAAGVSRGVNIRWRSVRGSYDPLPMLALTVLLVVGGLLSSSAALLPGESVAVLARLVLVVVALPWLAQTVLPERGDLVRAAGWLAAGSGLSAGGTILQLAFGAAIIPDASVTTAGRFSGFASNVSDTGAIAALGLLLGLGFIGSGYRARVRLFGVAVSAASLIGLVLSGSVSGMIAAAAGVVVYVIRRAIKWPLAVLGGGAGVAAAIIASNLQSQVEVALDPFERLQQALGLTAGGQYATAEFRARTYQAAWDSFLANPLVGNGLDTASAVADGEYAVHNLILAAAFQGGILLAIGLTIGLARPFTGRWIRRTRDIAVTQILAASIGMIVFAMTAPSLFNRYLWVPLALTIAWRAIMRREHPTGSLRDPARVSRP